MWSSADDTVRIATIRAIHRLASAPDESILDLVLKVRARIQTQRRLTNPHNILKNTYQTLLKSSKNTTAHSLPSITFMKNSASEIFCLNHQAAYQHAFRFIRQLAIHLRNSMKLKTKVCQFEYLRPFSKRFALFVQESYKQVHNWQYVHAIDFWSLVLARSCEVQGSTDDVKNGDMKPLIYPLVQIATGAIKCVTCHPYV